MQYGERPIIQYLSQLARRASKAWILVVVMYMTNVDTCTPVHLSFAVARDSAYQDYLLRDLIVGRRRGKSYPQQVDIV